MTQDATTTQTTPRQPGNSRLAYHYVGSLVAQMAALPASVSINSAQADDDDPAPYSVINYPALLILAKLARARILDKWQGYAYVHLKSMGWNKCGASDNTVKRATVFIQYQDAQPNYCWVCKMKLIVLPIALMMLTIVGCSSDSEDIEEYEVSGTVKAGAASLDHSMSESKSKIVKRSGKAGVAGGVVNVYEDMVQLKEKRDKQELEMHLKDAVNIVNHEIYLESLVAGKKLSIHKELLAECSNGYLSAGNQVACYGIELSSESEKQEVLFSKEEFGELVVKLQMNESLGSTPMAGGMKFSICKSANIGGIEIACNPKKKQMYLILSDFFATPKYDRLEILKMLNKPNN